MQSVRNLTVTLSDLAWLFHTSPARIRQWIGQGLPVNPDGSFTVSAVCDWREERHRSDLARKLTANSLRQKDLVRVLGVSRQAVTAWTRAGLPRDRGGAYSLPAVLGWLRRFYAAAGQRKYERSLETIRGKLRRNLAQCERFLAGGKSE